MRLPGIIYGVPPEVPPDVASDKGHLVKEQFMDGTTLQSVYGANQNPLSVDVERLAKQNSDRVSLGTGAARQTGQAAAQSNAPVQGQAPARDTASTTVAALKSPASNPIQDPATAAEQLSATRRTIMDPNAVASMSGMHNSNLLKSQIVSFS